MNYQCKSFYRTIELIVENFQYFVKIQIPSFALNDQLKAGKRVMEYRLMLLELGYLALYDNKSVGIESD